MEKIKVVKLTPHAQLPSKSSEYSVGWDIRACLVNHISFDPGTPEQVIRDALENYRLTIPPSTPVAIPTGLAFELPSDVEMAIKPRSGLFLRNGILAEGTIDPDYRGEVKIILINLGQNSLEISHGERIAQAVFRRVLNNDNLLLECSNLSDLSNTSRGRGGFGSTGLR